MAALLDKLPPQDIAAEAAILGAFMAGAEIPADLCAHHFYAEHHRKIFLAMRELRSAGHPIDSITVGHALEAYSQLDEVGEPMALAELMEATPNAWHADFYAQIIIDKYRRREAQYRIANIHEKLNIPNADFEELIGGLSFNDLSDKTEAYRRITGAELDGGDFETRYLVPHILAAGQPGGIFGAFKTLKTLIAVDLWISLGTGHKFLGHWPVNSEIVQSCGIPVALMSGESGLSALQDASRRICRHKDILLADTDKLLLSPDLPRLGQPKHIHLLRRFIVDNGLRVLILDPAYMCMSDLGNDAGNLFLVGEHLSRLTQIGHETGCTLIVVHHCGKRTNSTFEPAELSDIQWSGFAEWVRQWILLSRRSKYEADGDGKHELWMNIGGSAGHSGLWAVNISEGRGDAPGGRRWDVEIDRASKARAAAAADAHEKRETARENAKAETIRRHNSKIVQAMQAYPEGETLSNIASKAGLNPRIGRATMELLVEAGVAVPCDVQKSNRAKSYKGFNLAQCEPIGHSDNGTRTHCPNGAATTYQTTPLKGGVCLSDRSGGNGEAHESLSDSSDPEFVEGEPF